MSGFVGTDVCRIRQTPQRKHEILKHPHPACAWSSTIKTRSVRSRKFAVTKAGVAPEGDGRPAREARKRASEHHRHTGSSERFASGGSDRSLGISGPVTPDKAKG